MEKTSKIYVAGHKGLVGSAIVRKLREEGYVCILECTHDELDLTNQADTFGFFDRTRPDYVYLAAAKVGGIHANSTYPADFMYINTQIQNNVLEAARVTGVKKLLLLGSSCIYPKYAPQPMTEDCLMTGELEPSNAPYALAKIAGIMMCACYNKQHSTNFISCMPTNLYGPGDNYHPENSHVLPAMTRRFHEAKVESKPEVMIWGTGTPKREFLYVDDLADACVFLMESYEGSDTINVGSGVEVSIAELAELVKKVVGYEGEISYDKTKPDGTPRKLLDCSKIHALGWTDRTPFEEGIRLSYEDFVNHPRLKS